jgi:hypothetical protein
MEDLIRSGDLINASRTITALNTKLNEATADLAKWKIMVSGEVVSVNDGFSLVLSITKPNGQGFIKTINPTDVAYFIDDPESLVREIVDEIFTELLKVLIRNEISPVITRGLRNAQMMAERA